MVFQDSTVLLQPGPPSPSVLYLTSTLSAIAVVLAAVILILPRKK
ncbi:MAG: hypothetical protein ACTSV7_03180 [Candidatus Baldrarchaeia archaeon]